MGLDDEVADFELTANRGDLLSILGMAYELGAIYDKPVKEIDLKHNEENEDVNDSFNVEIETENCNLFLAKKALNVTIKESPDFIKNRLIASGIRPINNVVDISNYVMLEVGQPLHFYDADRLGNKILVRMAKNGEKLTTLDNIERELDQEDIVITNGTEAIGLAGVMGGLSTEVEEDTKNIIIESAVFDGVKIRCTSKRILRSEASNRFEKGLDPNRTYMAIERACSLLEKYADAKIAKGTVVYDKANKEAKKIDISFEDINNLLGIIVPDEATLDVFRKLGFEYKVNGRNVTVTVPTRRMDISIKEDSNDELKEKIEKLDAPTKIKNRLETELRRYESLSNTSPEVNVVRNYIDWLLELPWKEETIDNDDLDEKIIAIPKSDPFLKNCKDIKDLPEQYSAEIMHFFEVYKQLEDKKTEVKEMLGREEAEKIIEKCINNYNEKFLR